MMHKRHRPFFFVSLTLFISLVVLFFALPVSAHPLPVEDKEKIATIRAEGKNCEIYRILINGNYYILNTCGGMVAEQPMRVTLGRGTSE